jgi:ABC-type transport system involved in cytochrome bd biosynthesis fused ATPase/permease subunit
MVLKLGIATTALAGSALLIKGEIDVLTFFVFLLLVSDFFSCNRNPSGICQLVCFSS